MELYQLLHDVLTAMMLVSEHKSRGPTEIKHGGD